MIQAGKALRPPLSLSLFISASLYLSVLTPTKSSLTLNANRISCRPFCRGPRILPNPPDPESFLGYSVSRLPLLKIKTAI